VLPAVRLRQVALIARDCNQVAAELRSAFGWAAPYADPAVAQFGLINAVLTAGDTFVEVVSPVRSGTTAARYLDRRRRDGGYMAIFQVADLEAARRRATGLGVRVVWTADLPGISGTHLHPRDVPGAIVSVDRADPPQSWRWAGPSWTGRAPDHAPGGLTGLTVEVRDPVAAARRWAAVLGVTSAADGTGAVVALPAAGQRLRFQPARNDAAGITAVTIAGLPCRRPRQIGGVTFAASQP